MPKRKIISSEHLTLAIVGVVILLILFNALSGLFFGYSFWDVTSDQRYRLSPASREFLAANNQKLTFRLYVSKDLKKNSQLYGNYAEYIHRLLLQYVDYGKGNIKLEIEEIPPYSAPETVLRKLKLRPIDIGDYSHKLYLGANLIRSDSKAVSIPVFDIRRKSILEDDISRLMSIVASDKSPVVAVISPYFNIASLGKVILLDDDWEFIKSLKSGGFNIVPLSSNYDYIPEGIDAVLLYYPTELTPINLYALDQYLLYGGKVMVMLDSFSEAQVAQDNHYVNYDSGMGKFLTNLGVDFYNDMLAGDLDNNQETLIDGKQTAYPFYLKINREQMSSHPIMTNLHQLRHNYGSLLNFNPERSNLQSTILYSTGKNSGLLPVAWAASQTPAVIRRSIKPHNLQFPLALLLEGRFKPLYRRPLIDNDAYLLKTPVFINEAVKDGKLLLVSDSDLAVWANWRGNPDDDNASFYSSDNLLFIRNSLDYLTSSPYVSVGQKFISRGRENLNAIILHSAEKRFNRRYRQLSDDLQQVHTKLNNIEKENYTAKIKNSLGRQQKVYNLQKEENRLQQNLQFLEYQIRETHNSYMTWFAVLMMIIPTILSIIILALIYYVYKCYSRHQQRKIIHD